MIAVLWSWQWHPHPEAWVPFVVLEGSYLLAVTKLAPRERAVTGRQKVLFTLGALSLSLAADWPVHELAEELYSVHMLQHLILTLVGPPLMLVGCPTFLLRALLRLPGVLATVRTLSRPIAALVLFTSVLAVAHWPPAVALMSRSEAAHALFHAALVGSAFLVWIPVLSPVEQLPRLSPAGRMFYLLALSALPMLLASFLSAARFPIYLPYAASPRLGGISPTLDQRIAGALMGAGGLLLGLMGVIGWVRGQPDEYAAENRAEDGRAGP